MKQKENRVGTQVSNIRSWLDSIPSFRHCRCPYDASLDCPSSSTPSLPQQQPHNSSLRRCHQLRANSSTPTATPSSSLPPAPLPSTSPTSSPLPSSSSSSFAVVVRRSFVVVRLSSFLCRSLVVVPLSFVVRRSSFLCRSSFVVPLSFVVRCSLLHHFTTQTPAPESSFRGHHHSPISVYRSLTITHLLYVLRSASTRISK